MRDVEAVRLLVTRAKEGDAEALAELVRLHREMACRWARYVVRDAHLAEDVAQDACIRLQRTIGSLQDAARFRSWFRRMVRRLAINHIRGGARTVLAADEDMLARTDGSDPLDSLLRKERMRDALETPLAALSGQARSLMRAFAEEDQTPDELADRFRVATGNVYNIVSRSRAKANDERFRAETARYLAARRASGMPRSRTLPMPAYSRPYSLLAVAVYEALKAAGEEMWSLTDVMGISGEAFRLGVTAGCHWRGISTFDWSYAAYRTMERLGLHADCFGRPGRFPISPEQQVRMLELIHRSIDNGVPAVVWNLTINEFGLIYGYDDAAGTILYRNYRPTPELYAYARLGRNSEEPALFVAAIGKRVAAPAGETSVIAAIVDQARGKEPPVPGFAFGLGGYRLWLQSAESGSLDLLGHAYQVAILAEAREHATQFLTALSDKARSASARGSLAQAAECYRRAAQALLTLYPAFPFGFGGSDAGRLAAIASGLREAAAVEQEGIAHMEQAIGRS